MYLWGLNMIMVSIMNICMCAYVYSSSPLAVKLVLGVLTKCFQGKVFSVLISVTRGVVFSMNFIFISFDFVIKVRVIGITFRGGKAFRGTVVINPV